MIPVEIKHRPPGKSSSSVSGPVSGLLYVVVGLAVLIVSTPVAVVIYSVVTR